MLGSTDARGRIVDESPTACDNLYHNSPLLTTAIPVAALSGRGRGAKGAMPPRGHTPPAPLFTSKKSSQAKKGFLPYLFTRFPASSSSKSPTSAACAATFGSVFAVR